MVHINKILIKLKNSAVLIVAVVIASVVGGASTAAVMAAIPDSDGTVSACYKNNGGDLRVIDKDAAENCKNKETPIEWNTTQGAGNAQVLSNAFEVLYGPESDGKNILTLPDFGLVSVVTCRNDGVSNDAQFRYTNNSNSLVYVSESSQVTSVLEPGNSRNIDLGGTQSTILLSSGSDESAKTVSMNITMGANQSVTGCIFSAQAVIGT